MKSDIDLFDDHRWKSTCTGTFLVLLLLTLSGLACFPFEPFAGFILWIGGLLGGVAFSIGLHVARKHAFRCRTCGTTFFTPLQSLIAIGNRADDIQVHCPSCNEKRLAARLFVVYG
jgi:DNA-directed RNA polymerase subunit RPC12/RpoP